MAKLYITEFKKIGGKFGVDGPVLPSDGVDQTPVVIGAGSLQSAAFATTTRIIRVHTDAICSVAFGTNPTATVNTARMAAGQTEYYNVAAGEKIAVIANT